MPYNYYKDQLNQFNDSQIEIQAEDIIKVKFCNSKKETHWISLNLASLPVVVRFLSRVMEMEIKKEIK